ncbi:hypothetical protein QL093DRAFT_2210658 [Fusarium oxysporum]|nr:hypothetical protein QL093DRAFT_2210658 [Fusarium oxysporum]
MASRLRLPAEIKHAGLFRDLAAPLFIDSYFKTWHVMLEKRSLKTSQCQYCSLSVTDQFLAGVRIYLSERWRNFSVILAYIVFDIFDTVLRYHFFRSKK